MGVPPVKNGPHPFLFFEDRPKAVLYGRDAILRVRDKWLIFNTIPQLWADVKYHVPTGFVFLCFCFSPSSIYALNRILEPGVFCEPA